MQNPTPVATSVSHQHKPTPAERITIFVLELARAELNVKRSGFIRQEDMLSLMILVRSGVSALANGPSGRTIVKSVRLRVARLLA